MRTTGKVKWFNDAKGYGFIEAEDGVDVDIFLGNTPGGDNVC